MSLRATIGMTMMILTLRLMVMVMRGAFQSMWRDVAFMLDNM